MRLFACSILRLNSSSLPTALSLSNVIAGAWWRSMPNPPMPIVPAERMAPPSTRTTIATMIPTTTTTAV
jgi:hypothetical protein